MRRTSSKNRKAGLVTSPSQDKSIESFSTVSHEIDKDTTSGSESLLVKEYQEINNYVRSTCQLMIAWYTFFITGNLVALGWLISEAGKGHVVPLVYVTIVSVLFIVVNILSIIGCGLLISSLGNTNLRLADILDELKPYSGEHKSLSPCPHSLYKMLGYLFMISLCAVAGFWVLLLCLKINGAT